MKLSRLYDLEATWQAYRHDEDLLRMVREARRGSDHQGYFDVTLGETKLLNGAHDEPHDLDQYDALKNVVLGMVEEYLQRTLAVTKQELASLGVELDV